MCDTCLRICNAIGELRVEAGDRLTIDGQRRTQFFDELNVIVCNGKWTNWVDKAFSAITLADALESAVQARAAMTPDIPSEVEGNE